MWAGSSEGAPALKGSKAGCRIRMWGRETCFVRTVPEYELVRYLICIFFYPASSGLISSSASAPSQLLFVIFSVASKQKECCHVGEWKTTATSFKGAITQEFNCTSISISGSYKYEDGACPVQTNVGVALPAWISRVGGH